MLHLWSTKKVSDRRWGRALPTGRRSNTRSERTKSATAVRCSTDLVRRPLQRISSSVSATVFTQPLQVLFRRSFSLKYRCPLGVSRSQPFSSVRQMHVPCFDSNCDMSSRTFRYVSSVGVLSCPSPRPCLRPRVIMPPVIAPHTSCFAPSRRLTRKPISEQCPCRSLDHRKTSREPLERSCSRRETSPQQHRFLCS